MPFDKNINAFVITYKNTGFDGFKPNYFLKFQQNSNKTKISLLFIFIVFAISQLKSQSMVSVVENLKNNKEHVVKAGDKVKLDIKNKKGKLKEKEEVRISSIDKKTVYVQPLKNRFPDDGYEVIKNRIN